MMIDAEPHRPLFPLGRRSYTEAQGILMELFLFGISILAFWLAHKATQWNKARDAVARHGLHHPCWCCADTRGLRTLAPSELEVCDRCWKKIPPGQQIEIVIAVRDRSQGGVLAEAAELMARTIAESRLTSDGNRESP